MGKAQAACAGQLVFIPSYFDYVRVRALAKAAGAEFAALSEYAQVRSSVANPLCHSAITSAPLQ